MARIAIAARAGAVCFWIVAAPFAIAHVVGPDDLPAITPEAALADCEVLVSAFRDIHPGYTRYASADDMARAEARLRRDASSVSNEGEFYLAVQRYLASIRCEHTEAELPPRLAAWRAERATMLAVDFEMAEGRAIVMGVAPGVEGVDRGDELVSIDGRGIVRLIDEMSPYISVDGRTDFTRPNIFAGTDDIGLTTFDVLDPLLHGFVREYELALRSAGGEERRVRVPAVDEAASLAARGGEVEFANFGDPGAVRWSLIDPRTAMVSVTTFVNYRTPVDPASVFGPVFAEIGASGANRLILDMRSVGGGSGDVMQSLIEHVIDRPIRVGGPSRVRTFDFSAHRANMRTWAEGAFDMPPELFTMDDTGMYVVDPTVAGGMQVIDPAPNAWRGELFVLIGPNNESGATIMLAELHEQRPCTYVGQPTGGSAEGPTAGVIAFLTLPNSGIVARLPLVWSRTSAERFEPGMGVTSDVLVVPTVADVRAGRDAVLDAALSE